MTDIQNHWIEAKCAKAFWGQHDLPPYKQLLTDTVELADPKVGESWLDLGCGGGAISQALWERSAGGVSVLGVDCADANEAQYSRLRERLPAPVERFRF